MEKFRRRTAKISNTNKSARRHYTRNSEKHCNGAKYNKRRDYV